MKYYNLDLKNKKQLLNLKNRFDGNLVYGAKKFHNKTFRTGKGPANGKIVKELKKIISKKNHNIIIKKHWENINYCPLCKSKNRNFYLRRFCLDIYECLNCGLGYLSPRVKYKKAIELYSNEKTNVPIYSSKTNISMDKIKYRYGLSIINKLGSKKNKCLDLGTGRGIFLDTANKLGWEECYGTDANKNWNKFFKEKKGTTLINSSWENLQEINFKSRFDLITMWDALEHAYNLKYLMKFINLNLSKNGYFMIVVPNFHSLATKMIRNISPTFAWKHTLYFSQTSLNFFAKKFNLKCIHFETVVSEIDNIKSYMSGKWPYYGYGDPKNIFKFITPKLIHENLLGSRILAVFKKKK